MAYVDYSFVYCEDTITLSQKEVKTILPFLKKAIKAEEKLAEKNNIYKMKQSTFRKANIYFKHAINAERMQGIVDVISREIK